MAICPAHDDHHPSLSIRLADGRVLLHCFAGCSPRDIYAAIGLTPKYHPQRTPHKGFTLRVDREFFDRAVEILRFLEYAAHDSDILDSPIHHLFHKKDYLEYLLEEVGKPEATMEEAQKKAGIFKQLVWDLSAQLGFPELRNRKVVVCR